MTTEPRTESQQLEQRITNALATIREGWPHMMPKSAPAARLGSGGSKSAGIAGDNSAPEYDDLGRPRWRADHLPGSHDIDETTRLVSLRREVVESLNGWCRIVMSDRPVTEALPADGMDAAELVRFFLRHAQWFSGHESAPDMADEVEPLAQQVQQMVNPQRRDWIALGDCPFVHDGMFCRGQVRWWDIPGRDPACTECGQETVVEWWEEVLGVVRTVTYDGLQDWIRRHTGQDVKRPTIRTWLNRGVIQSCGVDAAGRTLFDKAAVAEFLAHRDRVA